MDTLLQAHTDAAAVFRNELDARILERLLNAGVQLLGNITLLALEIEQRGEPNARGRGQLFLSPAQEATSSSALPGGYHPLDKPVQKIRVKCLELLTRGAKACDSFCHGKTVIEECAL